MKCKRCQALDDAVLEARILIGSVVQALETYDADDGHNDLVRDGVVARLKELEDVHQKARRTK